jgi:hypothetical protein
MPPRKPYPPNFARHAPNGTLRTWGGGPQSPNQMDQDVGYLAMTHPHLRLRVWVVSIMVIGLMHRLCAHIAMSNEHKKDTCAKYAQAVARFPKKDVNGASTSVQGNSTAPAQ